MKKFSNYQHIIDLEYFFHQDDKSDSQQLHERDRTILLESQETSDQSPKNVKPNRKELIWTWLTARTRKEFGLEGTRSPGTIFSDTLLVAKNLSTLKGIIFGLLAGLSFFTYSGTTPVNVFHFLLFFVIPQLLFVALLLMVYLLQLIKPKIALPSFYSILFRGLTNKAIEILHKKWLRSLSAEKRTSVNHAFGIVKSRSNVYGSLFYWPVFVLFQLFTIGFNLGLLAVTLLKILATDLAFGWQSTLQLSTAGIYQTVKVIALPWSWFLPRVFSYPSLAEIEGSRIVLKEGIFHLATQDLIAWWPFLVFCLLFYGLFFRAGLLILGKVMENKGFAKLKLDTPKCISLAQRMQTPLVSTQAPKEKNAESQKQSSVGVERQRTMPQTHFLPQVVMIPDDIFDLCTAENLAPIILKEGFIIQELHKFMAGYEEDQHLKQLIADRNWQTEEGLFILMEAWMPPLMDFIGLMKDLRHNLPDSTIINLALVGKPGQTIFTPATPTDFTIWQNKIIAIGDPYLNLFSLIADQNYA